jgi:hypothetical protein
MINFEKYLTNIEYPIKKTSWDIAGTIKGKNGFYKFDTRPLKNNAKAGSFKTKADKIVYDVNDRYVIIDVEELHEYLKNNSKKIVALEDLINNFSWNIEIVK